MMDRRLALLPLLALAGTSLSGCVAAAIPVLAGSAMLGSRAIDGDDEAKAEPTAAAVPASPPAPVAKPVPVPRVTVVQITPPPAQTTAAPPTSPPPPVILAAPTPVIDTVLAPAPVAVRTPPPAPVAAPVTASVAVAAPKPVPPPVSVAATATVSPPPPPTRPAAAYPDPANPLATEQLGFARFVRYGQASAIGAKGGADLLSAMLADPVALDGRRRRCAAGEQPVALIDLDPEGGVFVPPANPAKQPGIALGLAVLREAGVEIAWLSDMSVNLSGSLRTALEQSGLDPRGEDIISLRRDEADTKQQRKDNLAGITCIVAIAGDERSDFDNRYKYLRSPEAGAGLEPVIDNGWFLIPSIFAEPGQ